jgi:predicted nuclease of predicted toxin-antitoxin system
LDRKKLCSSRIFFAYLRLREANDQQIFDFAKNNNAIVIAKDEDFVQLHHLLGSPPKIIWVTCGNTSNLRMRQILHLKLNDTLEALKNFNLIEITN